MSEDKIEMHPFTPFLPEGALAVLCGTFPPKRDKWAMDFFYPNFYNDMWRIFGLLYFNDKDWFFNVAEKTIDKEGIKKLLSSRNIGIGETVTQAVRLKDNASDKFLEIKKTVDLPALLTKVPECKVVATTGEKAASVIAGISGTPVPKLGGHQDCIAVMPDGQERNFVHWRLPSTSRAYPMKLDKKAAYYREMLEWAGCI